MKKNENPLISILFNIVIPSLILSKLSESLGPLICLIVALLFPFIYGLLDLWKQKKTNMISVLGMLNVILTGGIGLFQVDNFWFAVKEAAVPALIGIFVLFTASSSNPIMKMFIYNDLLFQKENIENKLKELLQTEKFDALLVKITYWIGASFFLSAVLNFVFAKYYVVSAPGSQEFNNEVGKFMIVSFIVISLPCTIILMAAFWKLIKGIQSLTGMNQEQILKIK